MEDDLYSNTPNTPTFPSSSPGVDISSGGGWFNLDALGSLGGVGDILLILLGILLFAALAGWVGSFFLNKFRRRQRFSNLTVLEVRLPENNEVKVEAADQMFNALYSLKKEFPQNILQGEVTLIFEVAGSKEGINFYVYCPKDLVDLVEKTIYAYYQQADITPVSLPDLSSHEKKALAIGFLVEDKANFRPIRTYKELHTDSLSNITSVMSNLAEGERAVVQYVIQPAGNSWKAAGRRFVAQTQKKENDPEKKVLIKTNPQIISKIEEMANQFAYKVAIRYMVTSPDKGRANMHAKNLTGSFAQFSNEVNKFTSNQPMFSGGLLRDFQMRAFPAGGLFGKTFSVLSTEELATVFHFPNKEVTTPLINWVKAKTAPVHPSIPDSGGTFIGYGYHRGVRRPVCIQQKDRMRHMYTIGKTGTGKSEFLIEMIKQDIADGHGVCVIDPHGELVDDILHFTPASRGEDVIVFDPADTERPMGLNILEHETEDEKHAITAGVINMMYKLFDPNRTGMVGPMFEHAVRNAMLTVMCEPGASFIEVVRCITDDNYVKTILPKVKDPLVRRYWTDEMAQTSQQTKSDSLGYIVSKFGKFITNGTMRNIIGQSKSAFNIREVMDNQKILLVNLSKGKLGEENSSFMGLLMVPRILAAAMARVNMAQEDRKPFFLYVDEFQNFATPDFAVILSEARKYKLALTVANQFIGQMQDDVKKAVFGNVGTQVVLRTGVEDADFLKREMEPVFDQNDIINQEKFHAYVKTIVGNEPVPPFSIDTTKDYEKHLAERAKGEKAAKAMIELSRLKYGRARRFVEAEINLRAKL